MLNKYGLNSNVDQLKEKVVFNVYLLLRERERQRYEWGKDREREGDTESEAGSRFRVVSTEPDEGLELTDHDLS